eukprot:TRINITY_DN66_c0_g1_i2.p1 TRINITY_DN66_c0_g1~~TRINITY_DN66_c0_g1_i2.p1  ORF type:complete len:272 (-),score=24.86 TRINITY_DN66_c0_g1_i2:115-930(-)
MSKILFVLLVCLAVVSCDNHYFTYADGKMKRNDESETKIFGSMAVVTGPRHNYVEIDGMYQGSKHMPFALVFDIQSSTQQGDQITITGNCEKGAWDGESIDTLKGEYKITGTWDKAVFEGNCMNSDSTLAFGVNLEATKYDCEVYKAEDAAARAQYLIGESKDHFLAAHVLNFAYYDYPYINVLRSCRYYLVHFGEDTTEEKPGYAIISKDGRHCAIIDKEGDKFIHTHPIKKQVEATPMSMLKNFFRSGYVIRTVPCKGPHQRAYNLLGY